MVTLHNTLLLFYHRFRQGINKPTINCKNALYVYVLLTVRRKLYSSCVQSSTLHRSETWPVRKENEVALHWAEMRMVRWMCGIKLQDRVPSKGLIERLGLDDIISVLQQYRLRWYGHVLRKESNDWVKKYMGYEVEGARPRRRPKKTKENLERDCGKRLSST